VVCLSVLLCRLEEEMWTWIQRRFQHTEPSPDVERVLVFYGLPSLDALPSAQCPSIVFPWLDEADAERCFAPLAAPALSLALLERFQERLADIDRTGLRDPNSSGRLRYLSDWLTQHGPAVIGWQLEPAETAGDGESWSG
jgi:hypothetical protein